MFLYCLKYNYILNMPRFMERGERQWTTFIKFEYLKAMDYRSDRSKVDEHYVLPFDC